MKILALEFSSPVRSVAVLGHGSARGYAEERGSRKTTPFALIDAALKQASTTREEVKCIAVGLGPGSYAGIRVAIAIAQGWQIACHVKLCGISSAEVVAAHAGQFGSYDVTVGLDVQRNEIWAARYDASIFEFPRCMEPFHALTDADRARLKNDSIFRMDLIDEASEGAGEVHFYPGADILAMLAAHRTNFVASSELEPIYLRKADFVKAPPPRALS